MSKENITNPVASAISTVLEGIIQRLNLDVSKSEQVRESFQSLKNIQSIYQQTEEQTYTASLASLQQLPLFDFQVQLVLTELIDKYFNRLALFKQAYEITGLKSNQKKYSRLTVEQPYIQLIVPEPYQCPPLCEAKQTGQAKCITYEDQEDTVQRFS